MKSSGSEHSPTFSADGQRIAFGSDRGGGTFNIWIADADGANPIRLTNFTHGFSGSPGWSPDGEWVAFDREGDIFLVRVAGGAPRRLTSDGADEFAPSWSKDGRWIYFGSDRGGNDQIWKVSIAGGEARQITAHGGACALESRDGKWLYYTKSNGQDGIWRVPPEGGLEEVVLDGLPSGWYSRYWALVENGIYYLNTRNSDRQAVEFFPFATRRVTRLFDLPEPAGPDWSSSFAVSPDQRTLLTVIIEPPDSDIMLVDNFQLSPESKLP
jgi:Tol biopolymer transport system component